MSTLQATNLKNASSGSNNIVLNADGTTTVAAPSNIIKSGTAVASTSGVAIDFTGIPSWAKRVTIMFNGVSLSGTSNYLIQIGAGSITSSGYTSACNSGSGALTTSTSGYLVSASNAAADLTFGPIVIVTLGSNAWLESGILNNSGATRISAGGVTLSGTLDRVRITTVNGTDTFDGGSINILYEG